MVQLDPHVGNWQEMIGEEMRRWVVTVVFVQGLLWAYVSLPSWAGGEQSFAAWLPRVPSLGCLSTFLTVLSLHTTLIWFRDPSPTYFWEKALSVPCCSFLCLHL